MSTKAISWDAVDAIGSSAASLFAAVGVILAALAIRMEARRWRAEIRRLDDERRDAQAAQAGLVVVVANRSVLGSGRAVLAVRNFSGQPVLDVHVRAVLDGQLVDRDQVVVEPVLAPDTELEFVVSAPHGREPFVSAEVQLRDSLGLRWRRSSNGPPQRLTGEIR